MEGDVRVALDRCAREGSEGDKGIVLRGDDESGYADGSDDLHGAGARVVVVGIAEAAKAGGDDVVEVADGADGAHAVDGVDFAIEASLEAHVLFEFCDEVALINEIAARGECVGAGGEIERGGDGDDGAELWRRCVGEFASHFEDEIAAHGEACGEDFRQGIPMDQFVDDGADILTKARVIQRGSEMLAAAAVALVEADHVEASAPGSFAGAADVVGVAGAFEAVKQDDGGMLRRIRLPMAAGEDARAGLDFEFARDARTEMRETAA